jgi:hypothetical protein
MQSNEKQGCFGYIIGFFRSILTGSDKTTGPHRGLFADWDDTPIRLPYRRRDDFLSPTELSYFKVLSSTLGHSATLFPKVKVSDIIFVTNTDEYMSFFNRISRRHVDFLVCESSTLKPVLAIELDDSSHNRPSQKERDQFLDDVFKAADLPLMRVSPKMQYTREKVISQIKSFLPGSKSPNASPSEENVVQTHTTLSSSEEAPPMCPKCEVPMVTRVASKGKWKGNRFYGCPNFPKCRQKLLVNPGKLAG